MKKSRLFVITVISALSMALSCGTALGEETSGDVDSSMVIIATGYEMPLSLSSNDITVITREEIARLPVHDVADVLNYVTGISVDRGGGPGTPSSLSIQGSDFRHVKVMIDGMPIESLSSDFPDTSMLDLNSVEQIEILKGSASSVWGSATGGVINIVTRRPAEDFTTSVNLSTGEGGTHRLQGSVSGKSGATGYYLSAKRFDSNGFSDNQAVRNGNLFGKATRELSTNLKMEGSYEYVDINREDSGWLAVEKTTEHRGRIKLDYSPGDDLDFTMDGYLRRMDYSLGDDFGEFVIDSEETFGGGLMSRWRHSEDATLSAGIELDVGKIRDYEFFSPRTSYSSENKKAIYVNEVIGFGSVTINAGLRYDDDSAYGSEASPSAGVVYRAAENTRFRLNVARGFTTPTITARYWGTSPNAGLNAERAWTYQAGAEQRLFDRLNSKVTFYRADVKGLISCDAQSCENVDEVEREGFEVELKTDEYRGARLSYGYAYNDVRDGSTGQILDGYVRVSQNVGLDYRGPFETRLSLRGHYVNWHADPFYNAKDHNFTWDARVSKHFVKWSSAVGEIFLSVHNLTDEDQYWIDSYPNAGRWIEGGITLTTF